MNDLEIWMLAKNLQYTSFRGKDCVAKAHLAISGYVWQRNKRPIRCDKCCLKCLVDIAVHTWWSYTYKYLRVVVERLKTEIYPFVHNHNNHVDQFNIHLHMIY